MMGNPTLGCLAIFTPLEMRLSYIPGPSLGSKVTNPCLLCALDYGAGISGIVGVGGIKRHCRKWWMTYIGVRWGALDLLWAGFVVDGGGLFLFMIDSWRPSAPPLTCMVDWMVNALRSDTVCLLCCGDGIDDGHPILIIVRGATLVPPSATLLHRKSLCYSNRRWRRQYQRDANTIECSKQLATERQSRRS